MPKTNSADVEVSDLKKHLGFWLRFVSNHVSHAFAQKLQASGVTVAEWVVLREIYGKEAVSPSAVAGRTGLTRGAVSKLVDRLFEKKLVTREESSLDRRFQDVALTPAGKRLIPQLAALADENDSQFFSALAAKEKDSLLEILKKLVQANRLSKIPID